MIYFEWSALPESNIDDRAAWAAANPALGIRIDADFIEIERASMTDEEFARERLGIFPDPDASTDESTVSMRDWNLCASKERAGDVFEGQWMAEPVVFGVDVSPDRSHASIVSAGACREGGIAVEIVDHREGASWLLARLIELWADHDAKAVVIDPRSGAGSLIEPLEKVQVNVAECGTSDHVRAVADMLDAIADHTVVHRQDPELDGAAAGVRPRNVGDAFLWQRRTGSVITPFVAAGLAVWGHNNVENPVVDISTQVF